MGIFYKTEDEQKMIKAIKRDIEMGQTIYSYYPVKGGWIYNSNLASISIGKYWNEKKEKK